MKARVGKLQVDAGVSSTKEALLDAAMGLMLIKGYTATSLDEICKAAGVTKGCLFHYFEGKEALAAAVMAHFCEGRDAHFRAAAFQSLADPLDRLFGILDFILEMVADPSTPTSCLLGNFAQEISATHPGLREICEHRFGEITGEYKALLDEAKSLHQPVSDVDTQGLANYLTALLQGTLILYKVRPDPAIFEKNVAHYKTYVRHLFGR